MTVELGEKSNLPLEARVIIAHQLKAVLLSGSADNIERVVDQLVETYGGKQLQSIIMEVASLFEKNSRGLVHEATKLAMDIDKIDDII